MTNRIFTSSAPPPRASGAARLAGFSIYISGTRNWWNGDLCFHDISTTLLNTNNDMHFFCTAPFEGRYVTIYNDRNSTGATYPDSYSKESILELCEVKVEGENS